MIGARWVTRLLVSATILASVACNRDAPARGDAEQVKVAKGGSVQLRFPPGWREVPDNPYDLQLSSKDDRATTGVFVFSKSDIAEGTAPRDILHRQVEDLRSKRRNFKLVEEERKVRHEDKTLTSVVYSGEKESLRSYYAFTLVEIDGHPETFVVALQVSIPSEWNERRPVLEKIIKSVQIRDSKPDRNP